MSRTGGGKARAAAQATATLAGALPRTTIRKPVDPRLQVGVGVLLIAVAGSVDAIGYIALGGFFASFMSGASISLGVGLNEGHWAAVYEGAVLVAVFLVGATGATVASGLAGVWALPTVLLLEAGLLACAVLLTGIGWPTSVSILPVVAAMGVQNTALSPVDGVRLGVTFMTGTLVSLGQHLGRALLGRGRPWSWSPHAWLWCAFCAGAGIGAALYAGFGFLAVAGPAAVVAATSLVVAVVVTIKRRCKPHALHRPS